MEDQWIQIRVSECQALLLRNWDLLSEETKQRLREIGIQPKQAPPATERLKNLGAVSPPS